MSWQPTPAAPQPGSTKSHPGRTLIWTGAVIFLIALVAGVVAVVNIVDSVGRPLTDAMKNPSYQTPADFEMQLDALRYTVYASRVDGKPSIGADDVTVTGPDGKDLTIDAAGDTLETISRGSKEYVGAARFLAPTAGAYQIRVEQQPQAIVVVAPSIEPSFEEIGYSVLAGLAAGLVGLIGLVLFIVGLVRRSSAKKQQAYAGQGYPQQGYPGQGYPQQGYPGQIQQAQQGQQAQQAQQGQGQPPAGWYPDPGTPGKSRYWDGSSWTEHQR